MGTHALLSLFHLSMGQKHMGPFPSLNISKGLAYVQCFTVLCFP